MALNELYGLGYNFSDRELESLAKVTKADVQRVAQTYLQHPTVVAQAGERPVGRLGRNVLMLPVDGLDSLASAVADVTSALGRPEPRARFLGHLTLARLKGAPACGLVGEHLAAAWTVDEVQLVESTLRQTGAEYRTISTVALGPRP